MVTNEKNTQCVTKNMQGERTDTDTESILEIVLKLSTDLSIDAHRVTQRVLQGVVDGMTPNAMDDFVAETAASLAVYHPDYAVLAGRVAVTKLYRTTAPTMTSVISQLSDDVGRVVSRHTERIDSQLCWDRDFRFDYFGFKTLERSYLLRDSSGQIIERPQVMLMRIALGIHGNMIEDAFETYHLMSRGAFAHATPTMFNAGTSHAHLASCFLMPIIEDSIEGIFETQKRCALISKSAGGIGFSVTNVRGEGSTIVSTGGRSNGLLPMLRCFEATARYVDQ